MPRGLTEITRRDVLRLLAVGTAAGLAAPALRAIGLVGTSLGPAGGFLTSQELAILDAATAHIFPTDALPGARECGVLQYIQSMLSFMPGADANCDRRVDATDVPATIGQLGRRGTRPGCRDSGDVNGDGAVDAGDVAGSTVAVYAAHPIFAGGPFSGRQAQPHFPTGSTPCFECHGAAPQTGGAALAAAPRAAIVDNYPPDAFADFLQPNRLKALSWKIRMLGAAAVPEVADNPLAREMVETDQRRKYRDGLDALENLSQQSFAKPFVALDDMQRSEVFDHADAEFVLLLTYHTVEGLLCAPEYGGNRDRLGWQLAKFDGDSQPLGYTIYDENLNGYRERTDKPNSKPNPDETCSGFSAALIRFLRVVSSADLTKPNKVFSSPFCFDLIS
jgi:hypothetical protein